MDTTTSLSTVVALLIALSIASERLVEIVKGIIPALNQEHRDGTKEGWRKSILQALAVVAGVVTAILARPAIAEMVPGPWSSFPGLLALGLLASGGSGFWNSIQAYILRVKDLKKLDVAKRKEHA